MRERPPSFPWFGVLLIVVGTLLLLDRLSIVDFGFARILWGTIIVFGLIQVVYGFSRNRNAKIFWGTVLFLYGVYFFTRTFEMFNARLLIPSSIIILGVAFLMLYFNNLKEWFLVIPGIGLTGIGLILFLGQLEVYEWWDVWIPIRKYWPVVLILTGVAILISSRSRHPTM
jgi:hypothetical protein